MIQKNGQVFDFDNDFPNIRGSRDLEELIELGKSLDGWCLRCLNDFYGEWSNHFSHLPPNFENENSAMVTWYQEPDKLNSLFEKQCHENKTTVSD